MAGRGKDFTKPAWLVQKERDTALGTSSASSKFSYDPQQGVYDPAGRNDGTQYDVAQYDNNHCDNTSYDKRQDNNSSRGGDSKTYDAHRPYGITENLLPPPYPTPLYPYPPPPPQQQQQPPPSTGYPRNNLPSEGGGHNNNRRRPREYDDDNNDRRRRHRDSSEEYHDDDSQRKKPYASSRVGGSDRSTLRARRLYVGGTDGFEEKELLNFFNKVILEAADIDNGALAVTVNDKNFAFVEFSEIEIMHAILNLGLLPYRGKLLKFQKPKDYECTRPIGPLPILDLTKVHDLEPLPKGVGSKLHVEGFPPEMDEASLARIFKQYGNLKLTQIVRDPTSKNRPYGFIEYTETSMADEALKDLNGKTTEGINFRVIKYAGEGSHRPNNRNRHRGPSPGGAGRSYADRNTSPYGGYNAPPPGMIPPPVSLPPPISGLGLPPLPPPPLSGASYYPLPPLPGAGGYPPPPLTGGGPGYPPPLVGYPPTGSGGYLPPPGYSLPPPPSKLQYPPPLPSDGRSLPSSSLHPMPPPSGILPPPPNLGQIGPYPHYNAPPPQSLPVPGPPPIIPTRVLLLLNMVTKQELANKQEYDEIFEEIEAEAKRYGNVTKVVIPKDGPGVERVFLYFVSPQHALQAYSALHNRKFSNRTVEGRFYDESKFLDNDYGQ